jgi:type I restriction enzyme S subunit
MISAADVPDHWATKEVEDICGYIQRGKQPDYDDEDGRVNIINQRCIYWDGLRLDNARKLDTDHEEKWQDYRYLQKGDVLVNSTGKGTLGRAQIWNIDTDEDYVVDGHVTVLRTNEKVQAEYLFQFLKSPFGQSQIEKFTRGATGQTELYKKHITSITVPIPPLEEQKKIVELVKQRFETINTLSRSVERIDKLTKEYEASLLAFLLAGKEDFSSNSLGEITTEVDIPDHWAMKETEDICGYIQRGKQPDYDDEDGRVNIINQRCIYWDGLRLDNARKLDTDHEEKWQDYRYLQKGDVLVNSTGKGTLGRAQIWNIDTDEDYVVDGHVTVLRTNEKVQAEYLFQFLKSPFGQSQIEKFTRGATGQTELYKKHITSITVPVPPLNEQEDIIEQVRDADMETVNRAVSDVNVLFDEYRESVLAHAFTQPPSESNQISAKKAITSET